jgi:hypothetical protein
MILPLKIIFLGKKFFLGLGHDCHPPLRDDHLRFFLNYLGLLCFRSDRREQGRSQDLTTGAEFPKIEEIQKKS